MTPLASHQILTARAPKHLPEPERDVEPNEARPLPAGVHGFAPGDKARNQRRPA